MTIQEYDKVFRSLDCDSKRALLEALEGNNHQDAHLDNLLAKMRKALSGDVPKYIPAKLEWYLNKEEGILTLKFRSDNPVDILAEKQRFLNDHLIAGEWPVVNVRESNDGLYTTYECKKRSKKKKSKKKDPMQENPVGHILSNLDKLPPEQKQALLKQLGV